MKILSTKEVNGMRRLTIELAPDEQLISIKPNSHYKLGHPVEDVVPAHVLADVRTVAWCPVEQKWVD